MTDPKHAPPPPTADIEDLKHSIVLLKRELARLRSGERLKKLEAVRISAELAWEYLDAEQGYTTGLTAALADIGKRFWETDDD